mmetsp:Transcript_7535/g.13631  ORF Transcript_7535/g.13631 Transcript_7535/m.13631 type:complete len:213 (-) Transcript_7535:2927-3565(-)
MVSSTNELACVYAALILSDDGLPVTADKLKTVVEAAGVSVDSMYAAMFASAAGSIDISQIVSQMASATPSAGGGAAPAAAGASAAAPEAAPAPAEEEEEEEQVLYYLSDGVYGSFNNIMFDHQSPMPQLSTRAKQTAEDHGLQNKKSTLFGPTCDSIDVICRDVTLPELDIGSWLYFLNMGAYTMAAASSFNGFSPPPAKYIITPGHIRSNT